MATEEQIQIAQCLGISVEEWQRRGAMRARANPEKTAGGVVMCQVRGDRVVRMDGSDSSDTVLMNSTPAELARYSRKYLDDYAASGDSADLARSASLISAALARSARR